MHDVYVSYVVSDGGILKRLPARTRFTHQCCVGYPVVYFLVRLNYRRSFQLIVIEFLCIFIGCVGMSSVIVVMSSVFAERVVRCVEKKGEDTFVFVVLGGGPFLFLSLSVADNHIILVLERYWQCRPYQPVLGNGDMLTSSYSLTISMISVTLS